MIAKNTGNLRDDLRDLTAAYGSGQITDVDLVMLSLGRVSSEPENVALNHLPSEIILAIADWLCDARTPEFLREIVDTRGFSRVEALIQEVRAEFVPDDTQIAPPPPRRIRVADESLVSALKNVRQDAHQDWVKDPWHLPEVAWMQKQGLSVLRAHMLSEVQSTSVPLSIPKSRGGERPAIGFDLLDRLAFQAQTDDNSIALSSTLQPWVFGWRLSRQSPHAGEYEANDREWQRYVRKILRSAHKYRYVARFDIENFFASIDRARFESALGDAMQPLVARAWRISRSAGRLGLPQRSLASSMLANAFLHHIDDRLQEFAMMNDGQPIRWADDYWYFSNSLAELQTVKSIFDSQISGHGLHANEHKARIGESKFETLAMQLAEMSYVDHLQAPWNHTRSRDDGRRMATERLGALATALTVDSEQFQFRFVGKEIRRARSFELARDFASRTELLPVAIDAIVPVIRAFRMSKDLEDWAARVAADRTQKGWVRYWAVKVFPIKSAPLARHIVSIADTLASASNEVASVVLHRVATWAPERAREIVFDAFRASNPQLDRVRALAAVAAGASRRDIFRILRSSGENIATIHMLRDIGTSPGALADIERAASIEDRTAGTI